MAHSQPIISKGAAYCDLLTSVLPIAKNGKGNYEVTLPFISDNAVLLKNGEQ